MATDPNEAGGWVVDPANPNRATYTDDYGDTYEIFKDAPAQDPTVERSGWQRVKDSYTDAVQYGFPGWAARKWHDWSDSYKDELRQKVPGQTEDWYEEKMDSIISKAQKGLREESAARQAADPNWKEDESFWEAAGQIDKWGPWFAGQVLGSAGPESLINPGGSAGARIASQAGVGGASDALYQGLDMLAEVADEFKVDQMLMGAATSAGLQGTFEIPGFIKNLFKERGADTTPDADPRGAPELREEVEPEVTVDYTETLDPREYSLDELAKIEQGGEWRLDPEQGLYTRVPQEELTSQQAVRSEAEALFQPKPQATPEAEVQVTKTVDTINELTKDWKNPPKFEVVHTVDDIPDEALRASVNGDKSVVGFVGPDGKVTVIASKAQTPEDIAAVTFHEGLGHSGLVQKFQDDLDGVLETLYDGSTGFKQKVDEWIARNPNAYDGSIARAADEVLAEMSEAGEITPSMMAKLRNHLKDFGRQLGIDLKYSDGEIRTILGMAHQTITQGTGAPVGSVIKYKTRREEMMAAREALADVKPNETRVVQPYEEEPDYRRFKHVTPEGKEITGYYTVEGDKLDNFSISSEGGARSIGPKAIRAIGRDLLAQHPEAKRIAGYRISGARGTSEFVESGPKFMRREDREPNVGAINPNKLNTVNDIDEYLYELNAVNPNRKTTWEETEQEALSRGLTPSRIAKRRGAEGLSSYLRAANIALNQQLENVAKAEARLATEGYSVQAHEAALKAMATLKAVHARVNYDNSEVGRALNILRMASQSKEHSKSILDAFEGLDNNILSDPEQFMKFMRQVKEQLDNGNETGATKMLSDVFKPKAEDYIFSIWYNMMLSSPATHTANFVGTGGNFIVDLLENTGAAIIGQGKRFSNVERVRGREVAYRVWGALNALKSASTWTNARESLNTGQTGGMANSKTGSSNLVFGGNPVADFASGIIEGPTRALAGSDEWWRNVLQLSNIYGLAVRNAGNKGLKGKAFWNEVNTLIANPTKEMLSATSDYTKVLQFLDKPSAIGKALVDLQTPKVDSSAAGRVARGVLRVAVPFVRTPDALIRTAIRRSGVLTPLERENIKGWQAGGAERDKVKARLMMGSFLSFWVATQAMQGNITGQGPADYKKKNEWLGSHQPNSIKVGDEWISIAGLEPVSTNLTAVSTLVERFKTGEISKDDYLKSATIAAMGIGSVISDNSYLEGLHSLLDIDANDPNKAENAATNFIANLASSATTPAALRKYTQTYDDTAVRDTTGDGSVTDRISGRIMSAVPGLSSQLPQKYDVYGRAQERQGFAGPDFGSRAQTRLEEDDPVIIELSRLADTTDKVIVGAPGKSGVKVDGVKRKLTAEEFQSYQHLSGYWIVESIREEMQTPEWNEGDDTYKIDVIKEITKDMRANARDYLFDPEDEELNEEEPEEGEEL